MEKRRSEDNSEVHSEVEGREIETSKMTKIGGRKTTAQREASRDSKVLRVGCAFFKLKSLILFLEGGLLVMIFLQLLMGILAGTVLMAIIISITFAIGMIQISIILIVCKKNSFSFQLKRTKANLSYEELDNGRDETSEKPLEDQGNPQDDTSVKKLDFLRKKRLLLVLRNDQEDPTLDQVDKRFSNNSEIFQDGNEHFLQKIISKSEGSQKSSEEQGNSTDRVFETLKSVRDRRIRDTLSSPDFPSLSSKRSAQEMSFAGSRGSESLQFRISKIGKSDKNIFQRRSDMFSFNNENMGSIKSGLSSKKSSSSLGEDLANTSLLKRSSKKKTTPEFLAVKTRKRSSPRQNKGSKRRMGQFYKTSYFTMQLKKIAELPEDDNDEDDLDKSATDNKSFSNTISNDASKSVEASKSIEIERSGGDKSNEEQENAKEEVKLRTNSKEESESDSSLPSSVTQSKASTVYTPLQAFQETENSKRASNISIDTLKRHQIRKSDAFTLYSNKNDAEAIANLGEGSQISLNQDLWRKETNKGPQNIFRGSPASQISASSEAYTFVSAPKFGGAKSISDKSSIAQSSRSPNFQLDKSNQEYIESSKKSSMMESEDQQESFHF
ncbi:unnamed protein product [Moneuplotes crassus]|uniref:Uncharacterized protein n=1 Tax=Euplotes crassus TaxID=5936 RepID=A0AAD1YBQ0_EUPCR|nr:unnamed protein product [Moneuplotes crassus]